MAHMHDRMQTIDSENGETHTNTHTIILRRDDYGVATLSRLLKMIGLFCRISSLS